jgi:hypothetical protein
MNTFVRMLLVAAMTLGMAGIALAVDTDFNAVVDVVQALTVTEDTQLDFGAVADNDGVIILGTGDAITSDASGIASGTPASGDFTITGTPGVTVTVGITIGSPGTGLTMSDVTTSPANVTTASQTLDGATGEFSFIMGATLTVDGDTAAVGDDQTLPFTISVTYD